VESVVYPVAADHVWGPLASANCYIEIAGRRVQLTLRDRDEDQLLARMAKLLERFPEG
jgi:hypothetical protein